MLVHASVDEETGQLRTYSCLTLLDWPSEYGAGAEIAMLQRLDIAPIALIDGADPVFPPKNGSVCVFQ